MSSTKKAVNLPVEKSTKKEVMAPRDPNLEMKNGAICAKLLKKMIDQTGSKVRIGKGEHVKVEAWQTVGRFYGVAPKTVKVEPITIGSVAGAHAVCELLDDKTGAVVGGAEAYCMKDEANWKAKPWFQLASMAQTRAISKALSNRFKFVCVLAGFNPTPAEEMDEVQIAPSVPTGAVPVSNEPEYAQPQTPQEKSFISEPQRKRFFAIAKKAGKTNEQIKNYLIVTLGTEHSSEIPRAKYEEACVWASQ